MTSLSRLSHPACELVSFGDAQELVAAVAGRWLHELLKHDGRRPYCAALSGGRIAMDFFEALADAAQSHRPVLEPVHFFWGDERCVPPDSPESNFKAAHQLFLQPLEIPEARIHRLRGEDPPGQAAQAAEAALRAIATTSAGQPVFDLVFLGMGEDGHVASLFPGESPETMRAPDVYRAVTAVKPPPRRITLGYATIATARQVWVLASGKGKEKALRESLSPAGKTPLARVIRSREQTLVFADAMA
ncbi:MAG: 6-phosphogluconolactonase [Verrucomicrobiota bacterium]